ncbi:cytochrome b5-like heme/steroid binding domain-containing protein [Aspergillus cavernicola]|uniref:Cytochrome b5-like heme/steroid binding domain-containing protein n=1 Tax=Aspergillus cavernicola TaxID=176166 RepID=A0ABR4J464_9EURO
MAVTRLISVKDVLLHNKPDDCWVAINGEGWDLSSFAREHPGGASVIIKYAGRDATDAFFEVHAAPIIRKNLSTDHLMSRIDPSTVTPGVEEIYPRCSTLGECETSVEFPHQ